VAMLEAVSTGATSMDWVSFCVSLLEKLWNGYYCGSMQMLYWVFYLGSIVGDSLIYRSAGNKS
jgi:hypothetical protein